ncbi:MAG: IS1380 family transposase [Treponema sp.]|jgi:hypothetical protein|nr:IS1380 family transposase [Treponema sp.]
MIKIQTTTESIESKGGLILAGKVAVKSGLKDIKSLIVTNAGTIITSLFGLMVEGRSDFESMGEKRGSLFFKEALGLAHVYAKETVRLYLERMAPEADTIIGQLRESTVKILRKAPMHGLWIKGKHYLPVDIDTTTMDNSKSNKEGVSRTYQGFDGYHPIVAYAGKEGYMLDSELRPGSQHCQKGTVEFIKGIIPRLGSIKKSGRILFRMDGGNDSFDTLEAVTAREGHYCIIKRNKRRENDEEWLTIAKRYGELAEPRKGKKVWVGAVQMHPQRKDEILEDIMCVFEVTERKTDRDGNRFLIPEIEVQSWWTNLICEAEKVIELYHGHATSEQFHSELKHDMGIERLPSGKFAVNRILFTVAMNAYNTLRLLGQKSIEPESRKMLKRKRLVKVIRDLICIAGKLIKHGRNLIFKINEKEPMLPVFLRLDAVLDSP